MPDIASIIDANEILEICYDLGVNAELYGSKLYRYRFNILIKP